MTLQNAIEYTMACFHLVDSFSQAEARIKETQDIYEKTLQGKWGVTETSAEQKHKQMEAQRRQFKPELKQQVSNIINQK
jgi:hypothetical protein